MLHSFLSPTHVSHITNINPFATLSRIKCERYIFLKNCVRSFIIVDYVSACICICIVVLWLYNTSKRATCLNPSVVSHSTWQGLKPSDPLTLLTGDHGPEIRRGEDADGLPHGTSSEFSANSAVPGNSSDIHGVPQF